MKAIALVIATTALIAGCGPSEHWRGGSPMCVTTACPKSGSLTGWEAVSVAGDDQTLTVIVPTGCGAKPTAQPVKVAQTRSAVVIGFFGPPRAGGFCAASAPVTFRLNSPLGSRRVYDAKSGKEQPVVHRFHGSGG